MRLACDVNRSGTKTALAKWIRKFDEHSFYKDAAVWYQILRDAPLAWSVCRQCLQQHILIRTTSGACEQRSVASFGSPIGGALLRDTRSVGWSMDDDWISKLVLSLKHKLNKKI